MKPARALLSAALLAAPALAFAQHAHTSSNHARQTVATRASAAPAPQIHLAVQRAKLDNGLRVVLSPDHTTPTVAVDVVYDVGGRNEERGHSGFAHLFEHMMFQGSANVARGEHFKLVTSHGGTLNGSTSEDRTNYFEMLPRSELPLAIFLEGDRMRALDISQFNFENQRKVVEEEYRMRVSNAPYVPAELRLDSMVNEGYWPYEHPAIGNMADLEAAQLEWVRKFHDAYYAPNNAVVAISGDFEPDEAMSLLRKYFGPIAPHEIPAYAPGPRPQQKAPHDAVMVDDHAELPAIMMGWPIPATRTPDHYPLEMLAMLLSDGDSSRLVSSLVRERAIATDVDTGTGDRRGPDSFYVTLKVASSSTVPQVQHAFDQILQRVQHAPPSEADMRKLRNRIESHFLFGLQSNFARAEKLAEFEMYWGDANLLLGELDKYRAVTAQDITRVAAQYLKPETRSRLEVKPGAAAAAPPKGH